MRCLVAEDDATSRVLLQRFLSKFGECDIAVDGKEAVQTVKTARQAKRSYDLVCMDLHMPVMNGQDAIREIREQESAAGVLRPAKIITLAQQSQRDAYLMKPIDTGKLHSELQEIGLIKK